MSGREGEEGAQPQQDIYWPIAAIPV